MKRQIKPVKLTLLVSAVVFSAGFAFAADKPRPPEQPKTGPGGAEYAHAEVKETSIGRGDGQAWFFEPAKPSPKQAPVIAFLHGWNAMQPAGYKAWIHHLVRRGNIVIYPRYQASSRTRPEVMTDNAIGAIKRALSELEREGHVKPDKKKFAVAGHSLGGVIAANVAARAAATGLPQARAVMSVEPGDSKNPRIAKKFAAQIKSILGDYSTISKGTLLLVVVGEDDRIVQDKTAKVIWQGVQHLPKKDRGFVTAASDWHGQPPLVANHLFPAAPGAARGRYSGLDALDYYGTWKLLDALTDAAFHGKNREYALGNTPEQRQMGKWSDGKPVKELKVLAK